MTQTICNTKSRPLALALTCFHKSASRPSGLYCSPSVSGSLGAPGGRVPARSEQGRKVGPEHLIKLNENWTSVEQHKCIDAQMLRNCTARHHTSTSLSFRKKAFLPPPGQTAALLAKDGSLAAKLMTIGAFCGKYSKHTKGDCPLLPKGPTSYTHQQKVNVKIVCRTSIAWQPLSN
eukprot:1157543-Pelagomonas_calceolata.AAC.5